MTAVSIDETNIGTFQLIARTLTAAMIVDEPTDVGGMGSGLNPYELLGSALGSCTLMTVRLYATRKNLPLSRARVTVAHNRLNGREIFEKSIELDGALDDDQRARIFAVSKKCPVHQILEQIAEVKSDLASPKTASVAPSPSLADHVADVNAVCDRAT